MEFVRAPLFRIWEIMTSSGVTDQDVRYIKHALLCAVFCFRRIEKTSVRYAAMQMREDLAAGHDACDWTALQKIQAVVAERDSLRLSTGKVPSAAAVSAHLEKHARVAGQNDKYSHAFVDSALTVSARMLSDANTAKPLTDFEDRFGSAAPPQLGL